jgi:hypothetical protein
MDLSKSPFAFMVRCLRVPALAVLACSGTLFAQPLAADSPFGSTGTGSASASAPQEAFELAGAMVQGSDVSVCIFERQKKRSQWIPVGGNSDGVQVVSYDDAHDTAIVMIAGGRKQLAMRKDTVASTTPSQLGRGPQMASAPTASTGPIAVASSDSAPPFPVTAATAANDQREARMLVSDLLEIGVQQRKAYQDAKLKAASGAPGAPSN